MFTRPVKVGFRYCGLAAEPDTTSQDGGQIRSLGTPLPLKAMYTPQRWGAQTANLSAIWLVVSGSAARPQ
ncbi:hypothetical protein LSTR_LSTR002306 [Laodelphax striatellus]|uniref:Uncharacterized protein n=1 Tax=Laodelphax striatellus TaxID=195883 RepID=A0A482XFG9_LAOST|nr:hypothetical protein LSTR_LSTR002306 [Laodelphax striatellus]